MDQLNKIYLGEITNWRGRWQGWEYRSMRPREQFGYIRLFQKTCAANKGQRSIRLPGTAAVINALTKDPLRGYGGIGVMPRT
jgi:hypothetical protein